jgi:hypothetical protein
MEFVYDFVRYVYRSKKKVKFLSTIHISSLFMYICIDRMNRNEIRFDHVDSEDRPDRVRYVNSGEKLEFFFINMSEFKDK